MRTTVDLPDSLLKRAKLEAQREGRTLSQLIERALRSMLLRPSAEPDERPFRLVTFGEGGLRPGLSFEHLKDIVDAEDVARIASRLSSRAADGDDAPPRR